MSQPTERQVRAKERRRFFREQHRLKKELERAEHAARKQEAKDAQAMRDELRRKMFADAKATAWISKADTYRIHARGMYQRYETAKTAVAGSVEADLVWEQYQNAANAGCLPVHVVQDMIPTLPSEDLTWSGIIDACRAGSLYFEYAPDVVSRHMAMFGEHVKRSNLRADIDAGLDDLMRQDPRFGTMVGRTVGLLINAELPLSFVQAYIMAHAAQDAAVDLNKLHKWELQLYQELKAWRQDRVVRSEQVRVLVFAHAVAQYRKHRKRGTANPAILQQAIQDLGTTPVGVWFWDQTKRRILRQAERMLEHPPAVATQQNRPGEVPGPPDTVKATKPDEPIA